MKRTFCKWISLLLAAVLTMGLIGSAAAEDVTLRFSWWGSDTRHQATLAAIELYESRNPGVKIVGEYGAFDSFYQKLVTQLTGGTEPDIITVDYKWVSNLLEMGRPFVNAYDLTDIIDMSGFDMDFARIYGGNDEYLIGLPVGVNGMGYMYNVEFLKEMGVDPSDSWTWDDVIAYGKQVQEKDASKHLLYNNAEHWMYLVKTMLKQKTGNTIIKDDLTLGYELQDLVEVFDYCAELVATGTVPSFEEGVLYETVYADQNPNWLNGNFGIFPTSSSLYPGIMAASEFEVSSMRYPVAADAVDPGILVTPSMFLTVSANSPHAEIAADFINFMLNDPEAIAILKDTRGIPVNEKAKAQLVEADVIIPQVSSMVAQAMTGAGIAENAPSLNTEVISLIKDYVQQVGYGTLTPEQAAEDFTRELQFIIDSL